MERSRLAKEKMARDEAVREKIELEKRLQYFEEEAQRANEALVNDLSPCVSCVVPQCDIYCCC